MRRNLGYERGVESALDEKLPRTDVDVAHRGRILSLDGLRGLACLAVVCHHCFAHAGSYRWPGRVTGVLGYGYLGVELFFALSGFCLAYPIFCRVGKNDWKKYARHRARRILPAYWGSFVVFGLIALIIYGGRIGPFAGTDVLRPASARELLLGICLIGVCLNDSYWTLTVEARWYFLLPMLIGIQRRVTDAGFLLGCVIVALGFGWVWGHAPLGTGLYFVGPLPFYLPVFAGGMILARRIAREQGSRRWLVWMGRGLFGLSLIAVGRWAPNDGVGFGFGRIAAGGTMACSLVGLALYDPLIRRALEWRPLVGLGAISYSVYLIHLPLINLAYQLTGPLGWSERTEFFVYQVVGVPVLVGTGYLFYLGFERPWLRTSAGAAAKPQASFALVDKRAA